MNLLNLPCDGLFISPDGILDKPCALPHSPNGVIAFYMTDGSGEFQPNLFVGNMRPLRLFIIGQVSQMNQQRQHIVPVPESHQIVRKAFRVHLSLHAANQLRDRSAQAVKIKADIPHQAVRGGCLRPV